MWILILLTLTILVVGGYLFYDLYWLSQPQVFLVYRDSAKFDKPDPSLIASIEKATGAKIATQSNLEDEVKEGLNFCANGMMLKGDGSDKNSYIVGVPTYVDQDFKGPSCKEGTCGATCDKDAGCVCGCFCNKMLNISGWGTAVRGVWMYGNKPARLPSSWSDKGWTLSPFSASRKESGKDIGKDIGNKYEIFGIPKLF